MPIWKRAVKAASEHLQNASAAHLSKIESSKDNSGRIVEHHLDRIRDREIGLSDFVRSTIGGLTQRAPDEEPRCADCGWIEGHATYCSKYDRSALRR